MFSALMHWDILQKIFLNTIFISIPEEFYIVMFTLILMGEFDYWKEKECRKLFDRWDYIRVFVPAIGSALVSNVIRYSGVNIDLITPISLLSVLILIIITGDIWRDASALKWVGKAFGFLLLALLTIATLELIYIPFILYGTGKTVLQVNNDIVLSFEVAIPERIIEYSIIIFFVVRKRTFLKAKLLIPIFESKILTSLSLMILIFNLSFMLIMVKAVIYEKAFVTLPTNFLTILISGVTIFPFLNMSIFIGSIYYVKNKEVEKHKNAVEKIYVLIDDIKTYTNYEKYDNIMWKFNGIEQDLKKIATSLFDIKKAEKRR